MMYSKDKLSKNLSQFYLELKKMFNTIITLYSNYCSIDVFFYTKLNNENCFAVRRSKIENFILFIIV